MAFEEHSAEKKIDEIDHFFISPSNYDASFLFYTQVMGMSITSTWGGGGESRGAILERGTVRMAIAERHRKEDISDGTEAAINGVHPTIYVAVDDLDARYRSLPDVSAVVIPLSETHWGINWFVVRDPDGNLFAYTQCK